jgi:hypothetical protein
VEKSAALSREEGTNSPGVTTEELTSCGGLDANGELAAAAAETGVVEAKRILGPFRIKGANLGIWFPVYVLGDKMPFFERRGLDRIRAFCAIDEYWKESVTDETEEV